VTLARDGAEESESVRTLLLADLRELFTAEPSAVLFIKEILAALHTRDDRHWSEYGKAAKPITGPGVAALLRPLGIPTNKTVRRGDKTDKGYRAEWFDDAFVRYLSAIQTVTRSQMSDSAGLGDSQSVTPREIVTDAMREKPSIPADCDRVTDQEPVPLEEELGVWTG
jgi:hypothetical protein